MPDVPTPKHDIPQPADGDFINTWPAIMRDALGDLDALIAVAIEDDPRPAAGVFGRFHRDADGTLSFDTGAAWVEIGRKSDLAEVPIATVLPYAGTVLPDEGGTWAWADGALIDRLADGNPTTFFNRVGHAYNGGLDPGSNKVRLPDKRGRVSVGAANFGQGLATGNGRAQVARGAGGGEEQHTLSSAAMPVHRHRVQGAGAVSADNRGIPAQAQPLGYMDNGGGPSFIENSGGGGAHNNLSPYEADNYIVRIA